jgi:hypothetical protein
MLAKPAREDEWVEVFGTPAGKGGQWKAQRNTPIGEKETDIGCSDRGRAL